MRIQQTEAWNDPLVQETVRKLQGRSDQAGLERLIDNPVLKVLDETGALDGVTAAVLCADVMSVGLDRGLVKALLPPEISQSYDVPLDAFVASAEGAARLFETGTPALQKMTVAMIVAETTGDDLLAALEAGPQGEKGANEALFSNLTSFTNNMTVGQAWKTIPPKLMERYIEGINNLTAFAPEAEGRRLADSVALLKSRATEEIAQEKADNTPPQIDPDCAFNRLKTVAKTKYKLKPT